MDGSGVVALLMIIIAKVLSIAGIGGLIVGLFIRQLPVALGLGVVLGVVDTLILAGNRATPVALEAWILAILVAGAMAALGWWIRGRKRPAK